MFFSKTLLAVLVAASAVSASAVPQSIPSECQACGPYLTVSLKSQSFSYKRLNKV